MNIKKVLVFPCGSECGLEIFKALQYEKYVEVYGVSSDYNNPGSFVYENYIEKGLAYITSESFIDDFNELLTSYEIDFVFPALDSVALFLAKHQDKLQAQVVGSPYDANYICRSKKRTYEKLAGVVSVPSLFSLDDLVEDKFPVFLKPDVGQGSNGIVVANDFESVKYHTSRNRDLLVMEYLPGREYTIDCFTDRHGKLRFAGGRERRRIKAGIAVNSVRNKDERFAVWAEKINEFIEFRGGWFFQVKETVGREFVLMEVASRMAGTSALSRNRGVNLPLLSFYDAMDIDVSILENDVDNEVDRTFFNRFRIGYEFNSIYVDFDDCLVIHGKVNTRLLEFLYKCINDGKKLILLTRHAANVEESLRRYRISELFDDIVHITNGQPKSKFIVDKCAIFIDDSHKEREEVSSKCGLNVFAPDAVVDLIF